MPSPRLVHDPDGLNTACWPAAARELVTPADRFFTRSHAAPPEVDSGWRLEVGGLVRQPARFSLEELLRSFPRREVTATLVCAGLRRQEFLALGPLPGELPWGPEAISTGRWSGIALRDLLEAVGVADGARHVELVGIDAVERQGQRFGFGGSIDLAKAWGGEVLLATELNGAPLPPAHGAPLRAVVPGWIGARSVKWLGRVTLAESPSHNYFQRRAYRVQREPTPGDPRDVTRGVALAEIPVNSAIAEPEPGTLVPAGALAVSGWAIGGGARPIAAVELSTNGGASWTSARLAAGPEWSWALWTAEVWLAPGPHTLVVRARDAAGCTQPAHVRDVWNVKGYNNNAWHRVSVQAT